MITGDIDEAIQAEMSFQLGLRGKRIVNAEDLSERHRAYSRYVDQHLQSVLLPESILIRFVFFEDKGVGARCFSCMVQDCELRVIALASGSVDYLFDLFPYMMTRYDCFSSLGIATREKNLPHGITLDPKKNPVAVLRSRGLAQQVEAYDPHRRAFGEIMADAAVKFLVLHEIGHCLNGHLSKSHLEFEEMSVSKKIARSHVLRLHTLEMDADAYAVTNLIAGMGFVSDKTDLRVWPGYENVPAYFQSLLPTVVAIAILFRIWLSPTGLLTLDDLLQGSHPPPTTRYHLAMVGILTYFDRRAEASFRAELLLSLLSSAWALAARSCIALQREPASHAQWVMHDDQFGPSGLYLNLLLKQWARIRPNLQERALIELAPVDQEAISRQLPIDEKEWLHDWETVEG